MKFKNKIFIIAMIMLILLSVACVSATQNDAVLVDNDDEVLTLNDDALQSEEVVEEKISSTNESDVLGEEGTFSELEAGFRQSHFTLEKDYKANSGDGRINLKNSIEIEGNGHFIDASGFTGILQADSSASNGINVVIKNVKFIDAKAEKGSVIYVKDARNVKLTLINCIIWDSTSTKEGGAIYFESSGGALTVTDTKFEGGQVQTSKDSTRGGIICMMDGHLKAEGSRFASFTTYARGGAIYSETTMEIDRCEFSQCSAIGNYAGAIYYDKNADLWIRNSTFFRCEAGNDGGALYINKNFNTYIIGCEFTGNKNIEGPDEKVASGGAIYNDGSGKMFLINSKFNSNHVYSNHASLLSDYKGGAIYTGADMDIGGCIFDGNYAKDHGGAIYTTAGIFWREEGSVFSNNFVRTETNIRLTVAKGGAIYASKFLNTAKNLVFLNNAAGYGGAIYLNNKNDVTFESCFFEGNFAKKYGGSSRGGAIYIDSGGSKLSLINNFFNDNNADDDKGVYNCGSYKTISNNWWGTNEPNFDDGYMMKWRNVPWSNLKVSDPSYLKIVLTGDTHIPVVGMSGNLTFKFVDNNGNDIAGKIINWNPHLSTDSSSSIHSIVIGDNKATAVFTPFLAGNHVVEAKLSYSGTGYAISLNVSVGGDFSYLQTLVNGANGILDLQRNFTYSEGIDTIIEGIKINTPLTINGNGHTIDAKGKSRIFDIYAGHVVINDLTIINGYAPNTASEGSISDVGGAIRLNGVNRVIVSNSIFRNNSANKEGGAIYSNGGSNTQILNCYFERNGADGMGGAISLYTRYSNIVNSTFFNNSANLGGSNIHHGGAIYIAEEASDTSIDNCRFSYNRAYNGGAISWKGQNGQVSNSLFISNKANVSQLFSETTSNQLIVTMEGFENYINAIEVDSQKPATLTLTNVIYWNGDVVMGSNPPNQIRAAGQNITIEVFKKEIGGNLTLAKNITAFTDLNGQARYNYTELEPGNYTFKAYHKDDSYYGDSQQVGGEFNVVYIPHYGSSVNITTPNGTEFEYGKVNVRWNYENRTEFRIFVTDLDGSRIFYDYRTSYDYFNEILPASDEYYNITIYNLDDGTYGLSKDSILFKVVKTDSFIKINNLPEEIHYPANAHITFEGDFDCHDYNVTIYDKNNNVAFSQIVWVAQTYGSIEIPVLNTGEYNITVTNLGNDNKKQNSISGHFKTFKILNNVTVTVDEGFFDENTTITVNASVDGEYTVKINTTKVTVNVVNGTGSKTLVLGAGHYTTNVTFSDDNYDLNATNADFTIEKVESEVFIYNPGNVALGQESIIYIGDDYPALYNVTLYVEADKINYTAIVNNNTFKLPALKLGQYNLTVTNLGNENITGSSDSIILNVTGDNYVEIITFDNAYGMEVTIYISADVDGTYTVDINGTMVDVEVEDGLGVYEDVLNLGVGNYTAQVLFDDSDYNNFLGNSTFVIYEGESNVQIEEIENVTYGNYVRIDFNDAYSLNYYVVVVNERGDVEFNTTVSFSGSKEMSIEIGDLAVGVYTVTIQNLGDDNVISSYDFADFKVLGNRAVVSDMTRGYNSGVDFTAYVLDQDGKPAEGVNVTFAIGGVKYVAVTNAQGIASINPKLNVGSYKVTVTDPTSGENITKTLNIVNRITGNKNVNTYYGKNYQYKVRIVGDDGKYVGEGIAVKVTVNGKAQTLKTDKNGYITVKFTKAYLPKTYTVTVEYKGVKVSNKVKVQKVLTLKKVKVKRSAKKLTLTATLKEGKKAIKGKKLVFKFKGKKYTAKTNKKGVAKVKIKSKVLKKLKAGKKVKYQVTYLKNTVKRTVKVKR